MKSLHIIIFSKRYNRDKLEKAKLKQFNFFIKIIIIRSSCPIPISSCYSVIVNKAFLIMILFHALF